MQLLCSIYFYDKSNLNLIFNEINLSGYVLNWTPSESYF